MKFKLRSENSDAKTNKTGNLKDLFSKIENKTKNPDVLKKIMEKKLIRICGGF